MRWIWLIAMALSNSASAQDTRAASWQTVALETLAPVDDDVRRHIAKPDYFVGLQVSEQRFVENGFNWHFIRFANAEKLDGPLWMVPHDDENAAFEAMIAAVKQHGGVGLVVNSGPGSARHMAGEGRCGEKADIVTSCDPNRNFANATPTFTAAFLGQRHPDRPVIALHTNSPGFSGDGQAGRGEITVLDVAAFTRGVTAPRSDAYFAVNPKPEMANHDTLGLTAYLAAEGSPKAAAIACRNSLTRAGAHFWHERVLLSDGSMSNYLALNRPDIAYFNAESRSEADLEIAAARHKHMVDAYLAGCAKSGDKPAP